MRKAKLWIHSQSPRELNRWLRQAARGLALFFFEEARDTLLAVFGHARDGVDFDAGGKCRSKRQPVHLIEQTLREHDGRAAHTLEAREVAFDLSLESGVHKDVIDQTESF